MRTNIEINDELMQNAMRASGAETKKAVVDEALQLLVRIRAQEGILKWFGKVDWQGDLEWSRNKDKWAESVARDEPVKRKSGKKAA
jgi:Arc/MetJ family transcription regulator